MLAWNDCVANAISQVAQKYGTVYLNTNSSSPTESSIDAHRTKFVWDANGANFSKAIVHYSRGTFGRRWTLLTSDYGWGRATANATRKLVEAEGGEIIDEKEVPRPKLTVIEGDRR